MSDLQSLVTTTVGFVFGLPLLALPWLLVIWIIKRVFFSRKDK